MYTVENFRSKKALREAVALRDVPVFQPGPFGPDARPGPACIEGPHYPEPHKFYASVIVSEGASGLCIKAGSKVS